MYFQKIIHVNIIVGRDGARAETPTEYPISIRTKPNSPQSSVVYKEQKKHVVIFNTIIFHFAVYHQVGKVINFAKED